MQTSGISSEALLADAVSDLRTPAFPAHLAAWLQSHLAQDNITALAYYQNRAPALLMVVSGHPWVHENIEDIYLTGAYLLDPFHGLHVAKAPPGAYRMSQIAPDRFRQNRYFLDYYRNTTLIDEIGFIAYPSPGVSVHICLGRDRSSDQRFTAREMATARRIAPIVTALIENHWHGLTSEGEYAERHITANLIEALKRQHDIALSPRQAEVAMLVLRGHSSVSIGLDLGISPQTVKVFRKQLYKRCGISSQGELFSLMLPLLGVA